MSRYPLVPLGEILEPSIDEVAVEPEATYPIAGVYSFGRGLFARTPIVGADTTYRKLHRLHAGQLVYSRLFAWEGALTMVASAFDGYHASPEFPTFTVRADVASPEFVGWLARWPELWDALRDKTTGLGLRRQRVPVDRLLTAKVPLPPLDEQARIVERMGRVALVRARAESSQGLARALGQSTLGAALGSASGHQLMPLGEILEPSIDEVAVEPETTYPIAGVYSFGRGLFARTPIVGADTKYAKLHRLHAGQLDMSRLNGWEGALAIVGSTHDGMFVSQEFPTFDVRPDVAAPGFVRLLARWHGLWDGLLRNARGIGAQTGARRLRVNADRLLATEVPLPPLDEQARIVERMGRVALVRARADDRVEKVVALEQATLNASLGVTASTTLP